jgi:hydrogenase maturation protease
VLVAGVGNLLLSDEGFGVHVARALMAEPRRLPAGAEVVEAGTSLFNAAIEVAGRTRLIVVDAIRRGGEPGTLHRFEVDARWLRDGAPAAPLSLHDWSVFDSLRAMAAMGRLPPRVTLVGAEPASLEPGLALTPAVAAAAARIRAMILKELRAAANAAPPAVAPPQRRGRAAARSTRRAPAVVRDRRRRSSDRRSGRA